MNAPTGARPWPSLAFLLLLGMGALQREPATALAQPAPVAAETLRDVAYGPHPRQRFDVHLPANPRGAPTIFFVHGGGWQRGDKAGALGDKARHWTAAGAIVISTNYRLLPEADPVEQAADVAGALAKAQSVVAARGGDPDAFALMGHSAGGHLVALLAASPELARAAGARPWRANVLLDAGAVDVVQRMEAGPPALLANAFGDDPGFWRKASPLHRLEARIAPTLAVCASGRPDSCAAHRAFVDKARALGGRAQLLPKPLDHAAINRTLGSDAGYTREIDDFLRDAGLPLDD
ncbi:MAG: alpha/beta hydrolase [Pseudomonadota bacterium]